MRNKKIAKQKEVGSGLLSQGLNPFTNTDYSQRYYELLSERQQLPAFKAKLKVLKLLEQNDVVIIQGETGSGKTTQIPQFLMESEFVSRGKIAVTQPRRIAAISIAKRVCEETDTNLGE